LEIIAAMKQAGFLPSTDDYALVVATLCPTEKVKWHQETSRRNSSSNFEHWKDALVILQEHDDLPTVAYNQVLLYLERIRKWKESTRLLRFMEVRSSDPSRKTTVATHPNLSTYSSVLECCLGANQPEQAVQVLQASLGRGLVPAVSFFEHVIQALCLKLQWRRALQIVQLMDDHNVTKTLQLYNALLTSCARSKEVVQAKHLLVQMRQKHGITPNIRSYNAVLSACASSSRWKEALAVLDQCHLEPGVQPDIYTYTNVIRACAKGVSFVYVCTCLMFLPKLM
jgi:pentatricopeptide repeat protein